MRRLLIPLSAVLLLPACTQPDPPPASATQSPTHQSAPPVTEQPTGTNTADPPATTTPADPSPRPLVSPSISFAPPSPGQSPEHIALRQVMEDYLRVFELYSNNPGLSDLSEAQRVTVEGSTEREVLVQYVKRLRDEGAHIKGLRIVKDAVIEVDSDLTATASYCLDSSATRLYRAGSSVPTLPPNPYLKETMWLERGTDGVWRVSNVKNETAKC